MLDLRFHSLITGLLLKALLKRVINACTVQKLMNGY